MWTGEQTKYVNVYERQTDKQTNRHWLGKAEVVTVAYIFYDILFYECNCV